MPYKIDRHRKLGEFGGINDALLAAKQFLELPCPLMIVHEDADTVEVVAKVEIDLYRITMLKKLPKENLEGE